MAIFHKGARMSLLRWKMHLAFGSALLTLLVTGAMSYRAVVVSTESSRWVRHTNEVLGKIYNLLFTMKSIESEVRGFLLTDDESFLDSHRANLLLVEQDLAAIGALTVDNPKQQQQISIVDTLVAAKIQHGEMVIGLRRTKGLAAVAGPGPEGPDQRIMGEFQAAADKMSDEELSLLGLREADTRRRLRQTKIVMIFGTVLGLMITFTAGWSALRDNTARELAEGALLKGEERFRDMANNISQLAWMTDEKGSFFWYNQRWFDYSGTTLEEMAGWGWQKVLHPDYVQAVVDKISRCFLSGEVWEDTFPLRDRNGNYRWFLSRAVPIRDAGGKVLRWFGTNTDISELRDSEKHIAQMEARYRGLLEAAPDAMVVVDGAGKIVLVNVQAENQFGYRRDELLGQKVTNIIPEGFAERLIADGTRSAEDALAQQIGTGIELTGRRKDRSEFPIEIMLSPLDSPEGTLVTAAIRNISVRKAAEKHLVQMEGRYRGLMEAAPDAMVVVDESGTIVLLNIQAEKQFGYRRDELLGQAVANIIPEGFAERLIADGARTAADALAQQIGMGIELSGRRKDRSEFPIEIMLSPLDSPAGILVTAAIRDISVRRAVDRHVAQMEARYRGLLEAAPDAMVVVNQNGEIVLLNVQAEKRFRYTRDELIGQKVTNIIPDGFAERMMTDALRSTDDALSQQIGTGIELTGRRKDGSEFPIEIMLSPLDSSEGVLVTAAIRDISERRMADEALQKRTADLRIEVAERRRAEEQMRLAKDTAEVANQAKSEFLANMSHEIRTPLNGVIGMTDQALETELTSAQRDCLETIKLSADSLLTVINDILDYSKIEAGKIELEIIDFNLRDCAEEALKTIASHADERGLELTCDFAPDVPELVEGDPGRLRQIILNLLSNAIKFTHHGEVALKVQIENEEGDMRVLRFTVTDTGIGISAEKQKLVFFPFTQADSSTTRKYGGTGLGLTISARLVAMMGGDIWLESEMGKGTEFHFTVRLKVLHTRPDLGVIVPVESLRGLRVLVVDDNRTNQRILQGMLTHWGAETTCIDSGEQALLQLDSASDDKQPYQLVLTDMHMPDMDGFGFVEQIRRSPEISPVTVMMLTSGGHWGDAERCRRLGIQSYLYKPIRKQELLTTILTALGRYQSPSRPAVMLPASPKSLLILLAEDNRINQTVATRMLERMGHSMVVAGNGKEALALLELHSFDLVLMDIQMPEMDGLTATMRIRENERSTQLHMPIVAMTAHAMTGDRERCIEAGMDGYITKPINRQHLEEALTLAISAGDVTTDSSGA
jgi:PAS domain S-box-containing protein